MKGSDRSPAPAAVRRVDGDANGRDLAASIDRLDALLRRSASLPDALSPDEKSAVLRLRRGIAEENARVFALIERMGSTEAAWLRVRHDARRLRSTIAAHLSRWPVSSIGAPDPAYDASLAALRSAYGTFIDGVRSALDG